MFKKILLVQWFVFLFLACCKNEKQNYESVNKSDTILNKNSSIPPKETSYSKYAITGLVNINNSQIPVEIMIKFASEDPNLINENLNQKLLSSLRETISLLFNESHSFKELNIDSDEHIFFVEGVEPRVDVVPNNRHE